MQQGGCTKTGPRRRSSKGVSRAAPQKKRHGAVVWEPLCLGACVGEQRGGPISAGAVVHLSHVLSTGHVRIERSSQRPAAHDSMRRARPLRRLLAPKRGGALGPRCDLRRPPGLLPPDFDAGGSHPMALRLAHCARLWAEGSARRRRWGSKIPVVCTRFRAGTGRGWHTQAERRLTCQGAQR